MRDTLLGARRMVEAVTRRIENESGEFDSELPEVVEVLMVVRAAEETLAALVRTLREEHGYTWADVGRELGITRQSAQERFGRRRGERAGR